MNKTNQKPFWKRIGIFILIMFIFSIFDCNAKHIGIVLQNNVLIYNHPDVGSYTRNKWKSPQEIIGKLQKNDIVEITEKYGAEVFNGFWDLWYKIQLKDEKSGWIFGHYIQQMVINEKDSNENLSGLNRNKYSISSIYTSGSENINFIYPDWSPDNRHIAVLKEYYHIRTGDGAGKVSDSIYLCVLDTKTNRLSEISRSFTYLSFWSPDGKKLLLQSVDSIYYWDLTSGTINTITGIKSEEYGPYIGAAEWLNNNEITFLISYFESFGTLYKCPISNNKPVKIGGAVQRYINKNDGTKSFGYSIQGEYSEGISASIIDLVTNKISNISYEELPYQNKNPFWKDKIIKVYCIQYGYYPNLIDKQIIYSIDETGRVLKTDTVPYFNTVNHISNSKWSNDGKYIVNIMNNKPWLVSTENFYCEEIIDKNKGLTLEYKDITNKQPFCWSPDNNQIIYCKNNSIYKITITGF